MEKINGEMGRWRNGEMEKINEERIKRKRKYERKDKEDKKYELK